MRPTTSASNLFRRQLCPGSARMEADLPEEETPQSKEGEILHDYSNHPEFDRAMLRPQQRDLLDLNTELVKDVVERVEIQLGEIDPPTHLTKDTSFENEYISGTPDEVYAYREQKAIVVVDWKFGFKIVERADLNLQLRSYAVLVSDDLKRKVEKAFVAITQPRLRYEERVTLAMYLPSDLEDSRAQIRGIIERSSKPDAPLVAGEEQCRYCKARLICPEFRKVFGDNLSPLSLLRHDHDLTAAAREAAIEKRMSELSDEEMEKVLVGLAMARIIKDPANTEARKRIAAGRLPNYWLSKEYEVRQIANPQRAISLLAMAGIRTREQLLAMADIPLGRVEEAYRKDSGCTAKEARETVNRVLKTVLETEKREARILRK